MDTDTGSSSEPKPVLIDIKFVVRCCPSSLTNEDSEDESSAEGAEEGEDGKSIKVMQCFCNRPLGEQRKEHPKWAWCVTEQGSNLLSENLCALCSRCPDSFGMNMDTDFEGYAMVELQENMLQAFHDAYTSETLSEVEKLLGMWAALEAAAFWLHADGTDMWRMCDDETRIGELVRLWGATIITMVRELIHADLFCDGRDAPIANLRLILCLFVAFGQSWDDLRGEAHWTDDLERLAESEGKFNLPNLHDLENDPKPVQESGGKIDAKASYKKWDHTSIFDAYVEAYSTSDRLGGSKFDIGKMSSAERSRYTVDKIDPIEEGMLPPEGTLMCSRYQC